MASRVKNDAYDGLTLNVIADTSECFKGKIFPKMEFTLCSSSYF